MGIEPTLEAWERRRSTIELHPLGDEVDAIIAVAFARLRTKMTL